MTQRIFRFFLSVFVFVTFPGALGVAFSQSEELSMVEKEAIRSAQFEGLILRKVESKFLDQRISEPQELNFVELSQIEENIVENLDSNWAWPENTLEIIDSYSPFLFRTKKSRELDEVKLLLHVNEKGQISGFDMLTRTDKGLKERLDHMVRKLPNCKPVPGFSQYIPESFELTISKDQLP